MHRIARTSIGAMLSAVLSVSAATAQSNIPTGTRLDRPIEPRKQAGDIQQVRLMMLDFAKCVVLRYRSEAETKLKLYINDKRNAAQYYKLAEHTISGGLCAFGDGALSMPLAAFRGAIFIALYQADFTSAQPALAQAPVDFSRDITGDTDDAARLYLSARQFADCVARADPQGVRAALLAPVGSEDERKAYGALGPSLNACLTPGLSITFSVTSLSGLLGEALYRESHAAAGQ